MVKIAITCIPCVFIVQNAIAGLFAETDFYCRIVCFIKKGWFLPKN